MSDQRMELWKRAKVVVDKLKADGSDDEAQYVMADFFVAYEDLDELAKRVADAEAALTD